MPQLANDLDVLFVDDDPELRRAVVKRFERDGYEIEAAEDGARALELVEKRRFDVAILDMVMPGLSGLDLLPKLREADSECEIIMLTGSGTIETAVEAMKRGARDFLTKPTSLDALEITVRKVGEHSHLRKENLQLRQVIERGTQKKSMIGESPQLEEVFRLIERVAPTDNAVLIQGETGTGKELVAHAIHVGSHLNKKPFVAINCAALAETLLESELFGHEKGSFTGAVTAKPGLFEVADGGTLFIDEMGELPGSLQAKLLRVLEDGSLRRVGSVKERKTKVRIIAATNRDLAEEVREKRFREDLYYRINVFCIDLPPLRERDGDLPRLIDHFLGDDWVIDPDTRKALQNYHWPGNIRQLINAIERAKIMADRGEIYLEDFPPEIEEALGERGATLESDDLATIQRSKIAEVMESEKGNKARAARVLGVSRRTLYRLLEKFEIDK